MWTYSRSLYNRAIIFVTTFQFDSQSKITEKYLISEELERRPEKKRIKFKCPCSLLSLTILSHIYSLIVPSSFYVVFIMYRISSELLCTSTTPKLLYSNTIQIIYTPIYLICVNALAMVYRKRKKKL